jgi:hypothetical protein
MSKKYSAFLVIIILIKPATQKESAPLNSNQRLPHNENTEEWWGLG